MLSPGITFSFYPPTALSSTNQPSPSPHRHAATDSRLPRLDIYSSQLEADVLEFLFEPEICLILPNDILYAPNLSATGAECAANTSKEFLV